MTGLIRKIQNYIYNISQTFEHFTFNFNKDELTAKLAYSFKKYNQNRTETPEMPVVCWPWPRTVGISEFSYYSIILSKQIHKFPLPFRSNHPQYWQSTIIYVTLNVISKLEKQKNEQENKTKNPRYIWSVGNDRRTQIITKLILIPF